MKQAQRVQGTGGNSSSTPTFSATAGELLVEEIDTSGVILTKEQTRTCSFNESFGRTCRVIQNNGVANLPTPGVNATVIFIRD